MKKRAFLSLILCVALLAGTVAGTGMTAAADDRTWLPGTGATGDIGRYTAANESDLDGHGTNRLAGLTPKKADGTEYTASKENDGTVRELKFLTDGRCTAMISPGIPI